MTHRRMLQAQIRLVGRCALTGLLAGLLATQTFAETAPATAPNNPAPAATPDAIPSLNALPEAPGAFESSSVTPAVLHLMVDDARQAEQAVSSPSTNQKRVQRPGMLVMGIVGVPLMAVGAWIYSIHTNSSKASSLKSEYGTFFMAPGAVMSGVGFYFAFHKK